MLHSAAMVTSAGDVTGLLVGFGIGVALGPSYAERKIALNARRPITFMIGGAVIAIVFGLLILVRPGIWPALVLCAAIGAVIFLAALVVYVLRRERCERRD